MSVEDVVCFTILPSGCLPLRGSSSVVYVTFYLAEDSPGSSVQPEGRTIRQLILQADFSTLVLLGFNTPVSPLATYLRPSSISFYL